MNLSDTLSSRRVQVAMLAVILVAGAGTGAFAWWNTRFQPPPSIFDTPVDGVLSYLTIDDFSQLPLKERLDFMLDLADRFRGLGSGESASMAAFLAGVTGPSRAQLEQNVRLLAKDALVEGAATYYTLPKDHRGDYIEKWTCDWIRYGERVTTGEESKKTDEELLRGIRRGAERDGERVADMGNIPSLNAEGAMSFLGFFSTQVQGTASPREQGQIAGFLDDVRGHFSPVF
ncbi:MAG: hypothetical protein O2819_04120 [Planctomycetota bacterium]|nr:hypothetical protein [Planctomycetota bacterium]MDA1105951.1 hypothetical protein [Planctomycetota bacterium]